LLNLPSIKISPEKMSYLKDGLVSFLGLYLFIHEKTTQYSQMFDSNGDLITVIPKVSVVTNEPKTLTKIYETLEIAGENLDLLEVIDISTKDATSEDLTIKLLESSWVAEFKNGSYIDTLGAEYIGIGTATNIVGVLVIFDYDINISSFAIGDELVSSDGSTITSHGTIITLDTRIITVDAPVIGDVADLFMARKNASIAGSDLRGLFLRMSLKIPITDYFRLNSVSTFGGQSKLHEE